MSEVDISVPDPLADKLADTNLWIKCYMKSGFRARGEDVALSLVESTQHHGADGVRPSDILGVQVIPPMIIINLSNPKVKAAALKQAHIQLHGKDLTLLDFVTTPLTKPRLTRISIHGVYHSVPDVVVADWVDKFSIRATPIERHLVKNATDMFKHLRTGHRFCYVEKFTERPPPRFTTISVPHPLNPSECTDIDLEVFCGQGQIVNCRRCKALDHKAYECPNITCFSCGMTGHTKANCASITETERHPTRRYERRSADRDDSVGFSPQTQDSVDMINRAFNKYVRPAVVPTPNRFQSLARLEDESDLAIAGAIRDIRVQHTDQRPSAVADADRRHLSNHRNKRRSRASRLMSAEEPHPNSDVTAPSYRPSNDRYNLRNRKRSLPSPEQRTHPATKKQNAERFQVSQGVPKPARDLHTKTVSHITTPPLTTDVPPLDLRTTCEESLSAMPATSPPVSTVSCDTVRDCATNTHSNSRPLVGE